MKRIKQNITLDPKVLEEIRAMAEGENRTVSNMAEVLLKEALAAREQFEEIFTDGP